MHTSMHSLSSTHHPQFIFSSLQIKWMFVPTAAVHTEGKGQLTGPTGGVGHLLGLSDHILHVLLLGARTTWVTGSQGQKVDTRTLNIYSPWVAHTMLNVRANPRHIFCPDRDSPMVLLYCLATLILSHVTINSPFISHYPTNFSFHTSLLS